ncbi:hypothetical protein [Chondromyces crocatus]|uniref:Uncharacterized protein n=1 Tax=Chondromyces crocatus TaxID=52 RepID=A0A0K1ERS4_CHOCO|nr:hypothetical protein [Chondromyces crocatus]AKT43615.1 uncharacterized protein CMC5_078500 [Chondromyces crocatus]
MTIPSKGKRPLAPLDAIITKLAENGHLEITFEDAQASPAEYALLVDHIEDAAPRTLTVVCDPTSPGSAFSDAFAGRTLPSVTAFIFDTDFQTLTRQGRNTCGDLADLLTAFPSLERAFVTGRNALHGVRHERLRALYLLGDPLHPETIDALGTCTFPALETLGLCLCSDHEPGPSDLTARALRALSAPALQSVTLSGLDETTRFLDALTRTPLPSSWSHLHLDGTVDDEDTLLDLLRARAPHLRSLTQLSLPLGDYLSLDGIDEAKRILLPLEVDDESDHGDTFLPATYSAW